TAWKSSSNFPSKSAPIRTTKNISKPSAKKWGIYCDPPRPAMLTPVQPRKIRAAGGSFAIVASRYNARYVDAMVEAAREELTKAGAGKIRLVRVPGAFEIPVVAAQLARSRPPCAAIICLGVILRGQTTHAQQIADAVSAALAQLQIQHALP